MRLYGVADCINIIAGWSLPPIRGAINALDADDAIRRLQLTGEVIDLDEVVGRLEVAFADQDHERGAVRVRRRE